MPPRVTYWTGNWNPGREAISNEIETLRRAFGNRSPVVAFGGAQPTRVRWRERVLQLGEKRGNLYRLAAVGFERFGHVTHAFGALESWYPLRSLGRRPLLFTVAIPGASIDHRLYARVSLFAVESEALAADVRSLGIPSGRVRLIYPGVNLSRFAPTAPPMGRFRVLFASSPSVPGEFEDRGITPLIQAARLLPRVEFVFLWRNWGQSPSLQAALEPTHPPDNVTIVRGDVADMATAYRDAHAVAALFAPGFGKSCPNSIVEGAACGRPAIVSETCGIAQLVAEESAGVVVPRTPSAIVAGIERLQSEYESFSAAARATAERWFDERTFTAAYARAYRELAGA